MTDRQFEENISLILRGNKDGLKAIYDEYIQVVYAVVNSVVKHPQNSEDITSEVFIKLWNKADTYRFGGKHKTWLITIARNTAIDSLRSDHYLLPVEDMEESEEPTDASLESQICDIIPLQNACSQLKPLEQQIVSMHVLGDLSFRAVSQILNKPLGTVAWTYRNAIQKLRGYEYD